ncbi:MAG: efflux RND transporter periplasmic adaptor subunit [Candidatus Binatia bacterium]
MKPRSWLVIVVTGALVLLALGLFRLGMIPSQQVTDAEEIVVAVAAVKPESRPVVLRISGELQPSAEVDVVSRLAGRLAEVKFKTGDSVTAGAVVATVYSGELRERARVVEAGLTATRTQLQEREQQVAAAEKRLAHDKELYRQDLIARRDVEQSEIQAATAQAELELARAHLAQEEAMLSQARKLQQLTRIVAPVSGVVAGALPAGVPVNEARAILAIAQIDRLKLVGAVPAGFKELIRDGMTAQVSPRAREWAGGARVGRVTRLDGTAVGDEIQLEISVDNRDRAMTVGTVVEAAITLAHQEQVLTLPRSALQAVAGQHHVFLIIDGRAVRRAVKPADENVDPVAIRDGLNAGDRVIANRLSEITEGARVRPAPTAK